MKSHTRSRKWMEAFCLAFGAGFGAVMLQPATAPVRMHLYAFLAASLPVLAIHARHGAAEPRIKAAPDPK